VTGNITGLARVGADSTCLQGLPTCVPFEMTDASVSLTNATGVYSGSIAVGTLTHADLFQMTELLQLSYLVDTVRIADITFDVSPSVNIVDTPPSVSAVRLRFLTGTATSTLLRPATSHNDDMPRILDGGDITVSTAPRTSCRLSLTSGNRKVSLGSRVATSLGLATWLMSSRVRERVRRELGYLNSKQLVNVLAVCTTIDVRMVMTRRAVLE